MLSYIRNGNLSVKQKFTEDLEKASKAIEIVTTSQGFSGNSPYEAVSDAIGKFDALPSGRRAILLLSDGLDATKNVNESTPSESLELERAILKAQKRSVAIYSVYVPATLSNRIDSIVKLNAQGSLDKLSEETGGQSFIRMIESPVLLEPFFREISMSLNRQFALTYLSTHMKKGYYKVQVYSTNPEIKIEHPKGYYYRKR
jgi:VWFA-related protein